MTVLVALAADLVAITVLVFAVYFPRHCRRDLVLAYLALNTGVMAVTALLASSEAGIGLGLGLFGVLSIIRLRSDAITQSEIAYYFIALALGLVNGLHPGPVWLAPAVSGALVVVMALGDHPRLAGGVQRRLLTLDRAYPDEGELRLAIEVLLGARVRRLEVLELDMVRDITVVDARYSPLHSGAGMPEPHRVASRVTVPAHVPQVSGR